ncbi:F-box domain, Skp2-like protein [Metarhizium guizhouense ARSEF 977]|uniref:F-box domain, Skp2-like protein n=1 Tax=Metarhizium guizhouense (strain ARSEF 977) TaxID=1276136 RepID=A0A0B4GVA0_METGA|nr:F-box domain, Skp2-like protein [Metarhizium guizhouense ARSEF 977]
MAAEFTKRSPLEKLPFEVLGMICAFLPRADLKALRLVSRAFDGPSLSTLFRTVYLKVHLGSFEKLQDISRSEKLSKHVRYISYDCRVLDDSAVSPDFAHWVANTACSGLCHRPDVRFFVQQFTQEELHGFYQNYHQFLSDQQHMLKGDNENRMLRDALQNLPRLLGVESRMPAPQELPPKQAWTQNSLSTVAQKILVEPDMLYGGELEATRHFWALLQSACLAGHAERLTHVHGECMELNSWRDAAASSLANYHGSFSSLQHLSLTFDDYEYSDEAVDHIADIIARAPSLRSLLLSFDRGDFMPFSKLVCPDVQLHHLRSLSLYGLCVTEAQLRDGLGAFRGTLRSLELADMYFCPGSWILFFKFLNKEMTLDHVKLYSGFSNYFDEEWTVRDEHYSPLPALAGASARDSRKYLVYRIERFITGRGRYPDPFTPRKKRDGDLEKYGYSLPWAFEQDRSWYHSDTLWLARKWQNT